MNTGDDMGQQLTQFEERKVAQLAERLERAEDARPQDRVVVVKATDDLARYLNSLVANVAARRQP